MNSVCRLSLGTAALLISLATCTAVHAQGPNQCLGAKNKCASKKMQGLVKCYNKAETATTNQDGVFTTCHDKAVCKYDGVTGCAPPGDPSRGCFAKAEAKAVPPAPACLTTGDKTPIENKIDAFVNDVVTELGGQTGTGPQPVNACEAAKDKCVLKKAAGLLKCHEKAVESGDSSGLQACLDKATCKYDGITGCASPNADKSCFAKAEAKAPPVCATTGDKTPLENKVDAFVQDVLCELGYQTLSCPTPTPSPTPTLTATFTPGGGQPTPTATLTGTPTPTATITPGGSCPTTFEFTAGGTNADLDYGWQAEVHDQHLPTMARLTLNVFNCPNASPPCGQCATFGPIPNAGGVAFANQRCRGDNLGNNGSWIQCTSNAACPGTGNACTFFFGAPQPVAAGGVSLCQTNEIVGAVVGTVDPGTGSAKMALSLTTNIYNANTQDNPCPRCVASACDVGPRAGQTCTINGTSAQFGDDTSLDCPPTGGAIFGTLAQSLQLATGTQTRTLTAANPNCSATGHTTERCFCDTCNNAVATVCSSNADCTAVGATICGGKRCVGGPNHGTPCTMNSECPSSVCGVAGAATQSNPCSDNTCTPNPSDTDSIDEGECAAGPFSQFCTMQTYRNCFVDSDCSASLPGDTCNPTAVARECYTTNGAIGNDVSVGGVASPTAPTFGALFCMPPTSSASVNIVYGLPGLGRLTIPGTAAFN